MTKNTGPTVIGPLKPKDSNDPYGTHFDIYGVGGWRVVNDIAARDAITLPRREEGMKVRLRSDGSEWVLGLPINSNLSWEPYDPEGDAVGSVLSSLASSPGAGLVGVADAAALLASSTVEGALSELARKAVPFPTKADLMDAATNPANPMYPLPDGAYTFGVSGRPNASPVTAKVTSGVVVSSDEAVVLASLQVEDFRVSSDTDVQVWTKAIAAMQAQKCLLRAGPITYNINTHMIVAGGYWNVEFNDTIMKNTGAFLNITAATAADPTYPTAADPGPMKGCCFYFTTTIYFARTVGICRWQNWRFAIACFNPLNTPFFKGQLCESSNAFFISYQGTQNPRFVDCGSSLTGVMVIAGASCFPAGTPHANKDNYYADGITFLTSDGTQSHNNERQPSFDAWFVASILRPSVPSVSTGTPGGYVYPFADDSNEACPSGRVWFQPMRNPRTVFNPVVKKLNIVGENDRGAVFINDLVSLGSFEDIGGEQVWQNDVGGAYIGVGLVNLGSVLDICTLRNMNTSSAPRAYNGNQHPVYTFTGKGAGGKEERTIFEAINPSPGPGTSPLSIGGKSGLRGEIRGNNLSHNAVQNIFPVFNPAANGAMTGSLLATSHGEMLQPDYANYNFILRDGGVTKFTLPFLTNDGYWRTDVAFGSPGYDFTGVVEIDVYNATLNQWDHGEFYISWMPNTGGPVTQTYTTAADINNGDTTITLTAAPAQPPGTLASVSFGGISVAVDHFIGAVAYLVGPVLGLGATFASGGVITRSQALKTLDPFKRGFVSFGFNVTFGGVANTLGLHNIVSAPATPLPNGNALFIVIKCRSATPADTFSLGVPVSGSWVKGAFVKESLSDTAIYGYECIQAGTPGLWAPILQSRSAYYVVGAGYTQTVAFGINQFIPDAAGRNGTINFPVGTRDGQIVEICATQNLGAITLNTAGGATINNPIVTLGADVTAKWRYRLSDNTWYRSS